MFGNLIDSVINTVIDVPASMLGISEENTQVVKNLALTGLTIYEITELTGLAYDAVEHIMDEM